jgi:hypothetical protein
MRSVPRTDAIVLVAGLVAASAAGVVAYDNVGPYGDGFATVGLYRTIDPQTKTPLLTRRVTRPDGAVVSYVFNEATQAFLELRTAGADGASGSENAGSDVRLHFKDGAPVRLDAGGVAMALDERTGRIKRGFSLAGNGVIDAWEYRNAQGQIEKIEISRRKEGVVDRWEFYRDGQLVRVEEDTNLDGRVDRWLTYEAGILLRESRDRTGDGKPDPGR